MTYREIHLELLLGKLVLDSRGKPIGRIQEVRVQQQGDEWVVQEYLLGTAALLERLSAWRIALGILPVLGTRKLHRGYSVPWDKLDLTDPDRPRLRCTLDELKTFSHSRSQL